MSDDYQPVHARPANGTEFDKNAEFAVDELTDIMSGMTNEELAGAQKVFAFHKKWTPFCGHKRLGRMYKLQ